MKTYFIHMQKEIAAGTLKINMPIKAISKIDAENIVMKQQLINKHHFNKTNALEFRNKYFKTIEVKDKKHLKILKKLFY